MNKTYLLELKRVFEDRSTILFAIVMSALTATAFYQMVSRPSQTLEEAIEYSVWISEMNVDSAQAELRSAEQYEPSSAGAKQIALDIQQENLQQIQRLEQIYEEYQDNKISDQEMNKAGWQTDISCTINFSSLFARKEFGDPDPVELWKTKLDWIDLSGHDIETYAETASTWQGFDSQKYHTIYNGLTKNTEKMLADYQAGIPYGYEKKGPVTFAKIYFASGSLSGYLLPIVFIIYFGMCSMSLHRSRGLFLSRTMPISPFKYFVLQISVQFAAALLVFLITFSVGMLISGFCFGWTDLFCFEFLSTGAWSSYLSEAGSFPSLTWMESYYMPVSLSAPYPSIELSLIPGWLLSLIYLGLFILMIASEDILINTASFLLPEVVALVILSALIGITAVSRNSFSILNLIPSAWPSVVDLVAGGMGIGWLGWIGSGLLISLISLVMDRFFLNRGDVY